MNYKNNISDTKKLNINQSLIFQTPKGTGVIFYIECRHLSLFQKMHLSYLEPLFFQCISVFMINLYLGHI